MSFGTLVQDMASTMSAPARTIPSRSASGPTICFGKQSSLTRAADHVEAAPISELHESTPHSFGSACFVDSRSVHMGAGACRPHLLCRRFAPAGVRARLLAQDAFPTVKRRFMASRTRSGSYLTSRPILRYGIARLFFWL